MTFLSCGQQSSVPNDLKLEEDSISKLKSDRINGKLPADSFSLVEQNKAINEIMFGINEKEFERAKTSFMNKTRIRKQIVMNMIGDYRFERLYGKFHDHGLYFIELTGCNFDYDEYDIRMPQQYRALIDLLESKYGSPETTNGMPKWTEVEKGYFWRCSIWEIGSKTIEVRVACQGTYFTLDLAVFKPKIENLIETEEELKSKESIKKGTKNL